MIGEGLTRIASRRAVIRNLASIGLVAPIAAGIGPSALATQTGAGDYHGHPVVGVWYSGGPTYEYQVYHADGTFQFYNPWIAAFAAQGDPKLAVVGFGVWVPTGNRTFDGSFRIAWLDASVTSLASFRTRGAVDETGDYFTGSYRSTLVDEAGQLIFSADGDGDVMRRLRLEPFDELATPESTPTT